MTSQEISTNHGKRSWGEAIRLYLSDAKKTQLVILGRFILLILSAYTPLAFLNDFFEPILGLADDFTIPVGLFAAWKAWKEIRRYRSVSLSL